MNWVITAAVLMMILMPAVPPDDTGGGGADGMSKISDDSGVAADDGFVPGNITLGDDAFHSDMPLHAETWYFECMSSNYSIVFIITLLSSDGHRGAAMAGLYIYNDGHMDVMERIPSFSFSASDETPLVRISGNTVVEGRVDGGHLVYSVSFEMNGNGIDLQFINDTRGWKGEEGMGWWLAVPEMHVSGTMKIEKKSRSIEGKGYHDHNAFSLLTPVFERGYMDGKILQGSTSIVWGYLMHSVWDTDAFAILSENGGYTAISPGSVKITVSSYIYDHGMIPTGVFISINDSKNGIFAEMNVTALNFHHIRLPFLRYWRYHVRVEGKVATPFHKEKIDEVGIMERMLY